MSKRKNRKPPRPRGDDVEIPSLSAREQLRNLVYRLCEESNAMEGEEVVLDVGAVATMRTELVQFARRCANLEPPAAKRSSISRSGSDAEPSDEMPPPLKM
jgi:hypothetical protein